MRNLFKLNNKATRTASSFICLLFTSAIIVKFEPVIFWWMNMERQLKNSQAIRGDV